jgi:predicted PhzF superfamily epimerase YddE/YHI9
MLGQGLVTAPYTATQGARLGRSGRVRIEQDSAGAIWVGGHTETLFSGLTGAAAF